VLAQAGLPQDHMFRWTGSAAGPAAGHLLHHCVRPDGESLLVHQGRFTGRAPARSRSAPTRTGGCGSAGRWRRSRPDASTPI
jgi:hypothetical protein